MLQSKIDRINELAHKAKQGSLTDAELAERKALREEYLSDIRQSMRAQLDSIVVEYEDGTRAKLAPNSLSPETMAQHNNLTNFPADHPESGR